MKFFLTLILTLIVLNNYCQISDSAKIKFQYEFSFIEDSITKKVEKDICLLLIGKEYSKYYSYLKYKRDSLVYDEVKKGAGTAQLLNNIGKYDTKGSPAIVYKNVSKDSLLLTTELVSDRFLIQEKVGFDWKINPDTMTILGYQCQKATTTFSGRNYTAWFSSAIPLNDGPWKFYGLPGLILKISDTKGYFNFECTGIESLVPEKRFTIKKESFLPITNEKFKKLVNLYYEDPLAYLIDIKGINFAVVGGGENQVKKIKPIMLEL